MKKNIKLFATALMVGSSLLGGMGCTGTFEDINTDPDNAKDVPTANLLAYTIEATGDYLWDRWFMFDEPATFCGYMSKMSYIDEAKYLYRSGVQDDNWEYIYRLLNNIMDIQRRSEEMPNMLNVAKVMEVQTIQKATDRWRDVPYSDAIKMTDGVLLPTYDTQEEIYPAMLAKLKEAADGFAAGGSDALEGDLLYDNDVTKWQKYCNSLRLRLAIRISAVMPDLAKSTIEEVLGNPTKYPIMESNDDNAIFQWDGSDSNFYEPLANDFRTRKTEYCSSDVMVNNQLSHKDPRISIYNDPTIESKDSDDPQYVGYTIGAATNPVSSKISIWGSKYFQDLGGISPWMRVSEVYFTIAEASKLGYATGTTAEEAYTKAVTFSMEENEISEADTKAYLEGAGKFDNTYEQIWYEEWVAMFKQGMEGWSLYRRTGVPDLYIAPGRAAKYKSHNCPPFRSPYPDTERNYNKVNNATFSADVVDDFWGKQMMWDKRTGVH